MRTPEETDAILGNTRVLSFASYARKRQRPAECQHQSFVIDEQHGTVECEGCGAVVSAFHALRTVARAESEYRIRMAAIKAEVGELKQYKPWLKAVKSLERRWRGKMLPCCPHCGGGVAADELASGASVSSEYEMARRKRDGMKPNIVGRLVKPDEDTSP